MPRHLFHPARRQRRLGLTPETPHLRSVSEAFSLGCSSLRRSGTERSEICRGVSGVGLKRFSGTGLQRPTDIFHIDYLSAEHVQSSYQSSSSVQSRSHTALGLSPALFSASSQGSIFAFDRSCIVDCKVISGVSETGPAHHPYNKGGVCRSHRITYHAFLAS